MGDRLKCYSYITVHFPAFGSSTVAVGENACVTALNLKHS